MDYHLTTNFKRNEFVCKCGCDREAMNKSFLNMIQELRDQLNRPLTITSGFRCQSHNLSVGGSVSSFHLIGRAADIACYSSHDRYTLLKAAIKLGFGGIGIYPFFVHLDNRIDKTKKLWLNK